MQYFLLNLVDLFFTVYIFMVFGYVLMSWVPNLRESAIGELIGKFVEPILTPFRKLIPPIGMIDISPIVAFIALRLAHFGAKSLVMMIFGA